MKQLYWKEWRELRMLPLTALAFYVALLIAVELIHRLASHGAIGFTTTMPILILTWIIFWLSAGSGTFSQEIGTGGLQFVSVLPISRRRFWYVKTSAAFCAALAVFALTTIFWLALTATFYHRELVDLFSLSNLGPIQERPLKECCIALGFVDLFLGYFAAGVCASPFFDRSISATVAAFIGGVFYAACIFHAFSRFNVFSHMQGSIPEFVLIGFVLSAVSIMPLLTVSYWTVVLGESLKSPKRFKVGALAALASCFAALIVFTFGAVAKIW